MPGGGKRPRPPQTSERSERLCVGGLGPAEPDKKTPVKTGRSHPTFPTKQPVPPLPPPTPWNLFKLRLLAAFVISFRGR